MAKEQTLDQNMIVNTDAINGAAERWELQADPNKPDEPPIEWDNTISHTFDVTGTYLSYETDHNGKEIEKSFKIRSSELPEPIRLSDQTIALYGSEGAFKNQLAPEIMPLLFQDYKRLRHYRVHNVTSWRNNSKLDLPSRIILMDRQQCLQFRERTSRATIVDPGLYPELVDLQTAIMEALHDPRGFQIQQNIRKKHKQKHVAGDVVRKTNSSLIDALRKKAEEKGINPAAHTKSGKLNI